MTRAAKKGSDAALALERMKVIGQNGEALFTALVAPAMDYASPVWSSKVTENGAAVQRTRAQTIVGAFRTVSLARSEAEASVTALEERLQKHQSLFWIKAKT